MNECRREFCPNCQAPMKHTGPPPPPEPPKVKRPKKVPNRPEWMDKFTVGLEGGDQYDCLYDGKSWALIREPGGMYFSGIGTQAYGRTTFEVWRKSTERWGAGRWYDAKDDVVKGHCLADIKVQNQVITRFEVHKGRMNKKLLADLVEQVKLLDKERP